MTYQLHQPIVVLVWSMGRWRVVRTQVSRILRDGTVYLRGWGKIVPGASGPDAGGEVFPTAEAAWARAHARDALADFVADVALLGRGPHDHITADMVLGARRALGMPEKTHGRPEDGR